MSSADIYVETVQRTGKLLISERLCAATKVLVLGLVWWFVFFLICMESFILGVCLTLRMHLSDGAVVFPL